MSTPVITATAAISTPLLGETCALLAAITWAVALVLFKRSGESIAPIPLSLFKNVVGLILLVLTMLVTGAGLEPLASLSGYDLFLLLISGVIGVAIADTILFFALNMIGVGMMTIAECMYTPSVLFFAWMFLREEILTHHYVGGALILIAVFVTASHKVPQNRTRKTLVLGMILGVASVMMMGFGIVIAKPIIEELPLLLGSTVRLAGGTAIMAVCMAISSRRAELFAVFRPSRHWKTCVPASIFGTYLAMIFWIGGFKYTTASIAAVLNQTSTVFALIFATAILKEPFTLRKGVSACLAFAGVVIVMLWNAPPV